MAKLDTIDWKILRELQKDGRVTNVDWPSAWGFRRRPRSGACSRWTGCMKGYRAQLDAEMLDYGVKLCLPSSASRARPRAKWRISNAG